VLITAGSIKGENIEASTISGVLIAANTITASKIAAGTITFNEIASNTLTSGQIADGTITGQKIVDGTISGVLIANGTITGSKVQANTISGALITAGTITATNIAVSGITADRLNVTQLDAVAANMGTLVVNSGISIGTNGTILAGAGTVNSPTTGLKIYTTSGVSRLTTYNAGIAQVDIDSTGKLKAGGNNVILDANGISIGTIDTAQPAAEALRILGSGGAGNIVGVAFYNGSYSATNPQATIQADGTNALEIENNASSAQTNINFSNLTTMGNLGVFNGHLDLRIGDGHSFTGAGAITGYDILSKVRYYIGSDEWKLNNAAEKTYFRMGQTANKPALIITGSGTVGSSASITLDNTSVGTAGQKQGYINLDGNSTLEITNQVTTGAINVNLPNGGTYSTYISSPATPQFSVNSAGATVTGTFNATGQTTLAALNASGAIGFGTSNNKFTVAAATGNTAIAGTLGVTGKFTANDLSYITVTRTATLALTTAGTTITWQGTAPRSNNITYSTTDITVPSAGYYLITGYFAVVDNVSMRMTLLRGGVNHVSINQATPLSTGGGYIFNFSNAIWLTANSVLRVVLTPSANTTLNQNGETGAGPSPFLHIIQLAGI
jgi:hypothetical protein